MDYYSMTNKDIAEEVGGRVKSLRLQRNLTQQQIADATVLSLNSIKSLEAGQAKLTTLIAVLRELGALEGVDKLVPGFAVTPLHLANQPGRMRQRASGRRVKASVKEKVTW